MNIPLRPISPVGCVDGVQFSLKSGLGGYEPLNMVQRMSNAG